MICRNCALQRFFQKSKFLLFQNTVFHKNSLRLCSTSVNDNLIEWDKIKSKYSDKQLSQVLNILNNCNVTEMKKYGVSENQIKLLELEQNERKVYKSLDDYILLDLIKVSQMQDICINITKKSEKSKSSKKVKSVVTPPIKKETLEKLKTALGLRIGTNYISWSHLELTGSHCNILNWDCHSFSDLPLNASLTEVIKMGLNIVHMIPNADVYVMEKELPKSMTKINASIFRFLIRQQQISSIVLTALLMRNPEQQINETTDDDSFGSLYTLRRFSSAQHFGLFFGNETVSANEVVQALIQFQSIKLQNVSSVSINDDILNYYSSASVYKKEEMNKSLLLTLTFFELAVLNQR